MPIDFLMVGAIGSLGLIFAIMTGQLNLSQYKAYVMPPSPLTPWKGKHPNGEITFIDYWRVNENNKRVWKFHGYRQEIPADDKRDVIKEDGCEAGQNGRYFIFRCNPDGSIPPWSEPAIAAEFAKRAQAQAELNTFVREQLEEQEIDRLASTSLKRKTEDSIAEDHVTSQFSFEKKLAEHMMKKKGITANNSKTSEVMQNGSGESAQSSQAGSN